MAITDVVSGFFEGVVKPVLDKIVPDAKDRLEAENIFFAYAHAINLAQLEVNKVEAQNQSLFVAGWRPAVGWVCVVSLFYAQVGYALLNWIFAMLNANTASVMIVPLHAPDSQVTLELLFAMLGLGGLRTFEKVKGVSA